MRVALVVLFLSPLLVAPSGASGRVSSRVLMLSEASLLARLTSPVSALSPLPAGARIAEVSSHDLLNGNFDGGSYSRQSPHPLTYVRREDGMYVLLDQPGPGCLVRMWMTSAYFFSFGDVSQFGRLQLFFDGRRRPSVDESATRFFAGNDSRFPQPLVDDWRSSSGGNYSYIPFCFAHRLEIRVTRVPPSGRGFFQFSLLSVPFGARVKTFSDADAAPAARTLAGSGAAPSSPSAVRITRRVRPGYSAGLVRLLHAGTIRYLRLTVTPFNEHTLQALWLCVAVDGRHPQIDVPLGSLFGDGLDTREIRSLGFGMSPADHSGYLALPIPYHNGVRVWIKAGVSASVGLRAWTGGPSPGAGTLFGQRKVERTVVGRDYVALDAGGSGRVASLVDEVLDGGVDDLHAHVARPDQGYMEGDDRVYVDGSRSPAIYGTGTEDIFNGGWYFNGGPFSLPLSGAGPLGIDPDGDGARSMYRIFTDDGVLWSSRIHFAIEHGGGDDRIGERVAVTTFSYRWSETLRPSDKITFATSASMRAHHLTGQVIHRSLRTYFEGEHSGNSYYVGQPFGAVYPAPPPSASSQSFAARGIEFKQPISFWLAVDPRNDGLVLRRLLDQAVVSPLTVTVDGQPAGLWRPNQFVDPAKRWLEADFDVPPGLTAGRRRIRVTLSPARGTIATAYTLESFSRLPSFH